MGFDNDHLGTRMPFGAPSTPSPGRLGERVKSTIPALPGGAYALNVESTAFRHLIRCFGHIESRERTPFRLAAEAVAGKARGPGDLTVVVAGVRVGSDDEFLVLASYAKPPWRPVGSGDLLNSACPAGPRLAG
jgi:hypothetical protein